jgi:hypothetical protein
LAPNSQATVFTAFRARYEGGLLDGELVDEKQWLGEVKRLFDDKANELQPLSRYRILGSVKYNIEPFLVSEGVGSGQAQTTGLD